MICALCQEREANKKNTHYLSDGIIRKCLNIHGTNHRERGYYFDISNGNPFVEFNFQRIDEETLDKALGRKPTDDELEKARQIPFSVDYVFCNVCEDIFTHYESPFSQNILPSLRDSDLAKSETVESENVELIRMFFYIQIWRSSVCERIFKLPDAIKERLRLLILNRTLDKSFPLIITYLETLGGDKSFTENYVGFTNDKNPYIIFMNDFIIQFFDDDQVINYNEFYGLNNREKFNSVVNIKEDSFTFNIIHNDERKALLKEIITAEKVKQTLKSLNGCFDLMWQNLFWGFPPIQIRQDYITGLVGGDNSNVLNLSKENIIEYTQKFFWNRLRQ